MTKQRYSSITTCGAIILGCTLLLTPLPAAYSQDDAQPESSSQEQEEQEQVDEEQEEDDRKLTQAEKEALRRDPCLKPPHPKGKLHGRGRECLGGSSGGIAKADFNGDGFGDLAIGVPGEDVGDIRDAGAVNVLYGSASGLSATGNQFLTQDSTDIAERPEESDQFGFALAAGDFDNDGFSDLAIGAPNEDLGDIFSAGAVNVIYGSASGLRPSGNQLWTQDTPGVLDQAEADDRFGSSLNWADFNGDGFGDLAIGVPSEAVGDIFRAGAVNVLYGFAGGLRVTNNQFWTQDSPGILDFAELNEFFGRPLAAGDFDGDGFFDLAIGVVSEDVGDINGAGAVNVIYGTAAGLSATNDQFWSQNSPGIVDAAERHDHFGQALAAGDFDGDGFFDLAIGVRFEDVGDIEDPGAVNVLYGSTNRLSATDNQLWTQDSPGIVDAAELDDSFGNALAAGDFNGDGKKDLAIGVLLEDIFISFSRTNITNAGAVNVIYGSSDGLTETGNQFWSQDSAGVFDSAEENDAFGSRLTAWDFGNGTQADLAVGVSLENVGTLISAGAVNVLYGSANRLNPANNQLWTQDSPDVLDQAEDGDHFGQALY